MRYRPSYLLPLLLLATAASACGDSDSPEIGADQRFTCVMEDRRDLYSPNLVKSGPAGYQVRLMASDPGPPVRGDNVWTFELIEPNGAVATDVEVAIDPRMPDHGHGTPVTANVTAPEATGTAYTAGPINLFMPGLWVVHVNLARGGELLDTVDFSFCIDG